MNNELKADIIPQSVLDTAKFIKDCHKSGDRYIISGGRRYGLTFAHNLANKTEDTDCEIIDPVRQKKAQ